MSFLQDYEPVEDRLRAFWNEHEDGHIETELVHHADGEYIFKATIWRHGEDRPAATGYARDAVNSLPPNMKASALEVAETSAIGRALANLGYAPKGRRPSREEMSKASASPSSAGGPSAPRGGPSTARKGKAAPKPEGEGSEILPDSSPPPSSGSELWDGIEVQR